MRRIKKSDRLRRTKAIIGYKISRKLLLLFIILVTLALGVSVAVVREALALRHEIRDRTNNYVTDVSYQLTEDIDNQITDITSMLTSMGDSLLQVRNQAVDGEAAIDYYLERKGQVLGFDSFLLVDVAGRSRWTDVVPQIVNQGFTAEECMDFPGIQKSFQGRESVTVLPDGDILYSVPMKREGKIVGVLGGVRPKEKMESLINVHSFSGNGTDCLIDSSGQVLVSGEGLEFAQDIDDVFCKQETPESDFDLYRDKLHEAMGQQKSGVIRFCGHLESRQAVQELLMAYYPLSIGDWYLITLIPSNILVSEVNKYVNQTMLSIVILIILTSASILILFLRQRAHYQQMSDAIFSDPVTGGMNNAAFQKRCRQVLDEASPGEYSIVLLHIKDFKLVNDQMGVEYGNQALRHIMWILEEQVKDSGFVARSFADNFYLCVREGEPERIIRLIREIEKEVAADFEKAKSKAELKYQCILQPGVYIVSEPGLDVTVMQDRAKAASRDRSLAEDGICKFYDMFVMEKVARAQAVNSRFEDSVRDGDFQVYFQPKVCVKNGRTGGAEALARWVLPGRGMIPTAEFIPLLEDSGKICDLDVYIFRETCRIMERWLQEGRELIPVSVNISRRHFQKDGDFLEEYAEIAREFHIPNGQIELELTESLFFNDSIVEKVRESIRKIHDCGFLFSMDDFGSGYSSFRLLMELDVDVLKLDRKFFVDIKNEKVRYMLEEIVKVAHRIGAQVVAEGVETQEQLAFVREIGCDMVQGFVYSRPLPVGEFERWIKR